MKIALVHDYIKEYGGAERVLEALHEIWPEAPIFTTVYLPEFLGPHKERFKNWDIRTSFLQYLPFKAKLISPFRIIAPFMFKSFDLSKFDVIIISATGAYIPNMIRCHPEFISGSRLIEIPKRVRNDTFKKPIHICYCHTPPRYLYGYATARDWKKSIILGSIGKIANHFLRLIDFKAAQNVDYFIANSKNVAERIKKFYRREITVIYPPVDTGIKYRVLSIKGEERSAKQAKYAILNTQYYLAGGRLARPKHIDLIVRACKELNVPLKVFGRGFAGYDTTELKVESGKPVLSEVEGLKVDFVGEVNDEEKLELMRNAKAYIFAAEDEDFGITPVEAMTVGTPVIAYRSGGVVESVVEGKTGLFFDELTVESLVHTIKKLNDSSHFIKREDSIRQAKKFSKERFKKEIQLFVEKIYKKNL